MAISMKRSYALLKAGMGLVCTAVLVVVIASTVFVPTSAADEAKHKAAKAKGKITWYTSVWPEQLRNELAEDFRAKTGLDLVIGYVGGTGQVVTRIATERMTEAYNVDVVDLVDEEVINGLTKDSVLRAYKSANSKNIISTCKDEAGYWSGFYFWALLMEYNTDRLDKADVPKSWSELNDPKWKGKVVVADPNKSASGLGFVKAMVKLEGWDWIEKLAKNDLLVQTSGPGVHQSVLKGERIVGAPVSSFHSKTREQDGPVAMAMEEVLFVAPSVISVVTKSPNPEGAELFADYLLSKEVAERYLNYGWFTCRDDMPGPYGLPSADKLKMKFAAPPSIGMSGPDVAARFHKIFQDAQ
jgi:iron(III) transport system substrate-binding protein